MTDSTPARREVQDRLRSLAGVTSALANGDWPADVETLDALADLVQAASRWALVSELEAA